MDMGIIFLILLIFFGAKKLPEFARSMGQAVREFSKAKDEFEREITRPPEPARPAQLEHTSESDPHHHATESVTTVETHPVTTAEAQPVKPEGIQPYESASAHPSPVVEEPAHKS
jgi:sec-independent protein translocase protein TatA